MTYDVFVTEIAEQDLFEIVTYIDVHDSTDKADHVYSKIKQVINSLNKHPLRGHYPPELEKISIYDYLELHFKPYRIIYSVEDKNVFVHCILDGRREMSALLTKRLTR